MSDTKTTKKQNAIIWSRISAEMVGWPMLIVAIFGYAQKIIFTLTCEAAGYQCQYAFRASAPQAQVAESDDGDRVRMLEDRVSSLNDSLGVLADGLGLMDGSSGKKGKP